MATYDLEEQEQLDEIKVWWKQYGNLVVSLLTAASIAVIAWQGWNWYQRNQAAQASMVYGVLQKAVAEKDSQRIKAASGELLEKFSGTTYAPLGALITAKAMFEAGDAKTAKAQLSWVVEHGKDELRDLARVRLAAVLLDEKVYDEALKQLDGSFSAGFASRVAETRGDVLDAQGKSRRRAPPTSWHLPGLMKVTRQERARIHCRTSRLMRHIVTCCSRSSIRSGRASNEPTLRCSLAAISAGGLLDHRVDEPVRQFERAEDGRVAADQGNGRSPRALA